MEAFIALLLAAISVLLFYRWVSRKHKIIFLKVVGVLFALALGLVGLEFWRTEWLPHRERELVTVTRKPDFSGLDSPNPAAKYREASGWPDTLTAIDLDVCNNHRRKPLHYVKFSLETYPQGRSTPRNVILSAHGEGAEMYLSSDIIVPPKECASISWTGLYQVFDSVVATPVTVRMGS